MSYVILTAILTSTLVSILVGRIILLLQYKSTSAGYRLYKVATATREMMHNLNMAEKNASLLLSGHRYSLGLLLYRCNLAFGSNREKTVYPVLHGEPAFWSFYHDHVRPVLQDINNNSFIGWLPTTEMRRLRALVALCYQVETILSEMTSESWPNEYASVIVPEHLFVINKPLPGNAPVIKDYEKLRQCWLNWLALLPPNKTKKTAF